MEHTYFPRHDLAVWKDFAKITFFGSRGSELRILEEVASVHVLSDNR